MNMALVPSLFPWSRGRNEVSAPAPYGSDVTPFVGLHREVNRLFDDFFRGFDMAPFGRGPQWATGWPNVEVSETDKEIKVSAELPGLEEKDVEVTLNNGVLTLKGEKKTETESSTYSERWHGRFQRSIQLAHEVDPDHVSSTFKNGVLTVTLPVKPDGQGQVKRIPIGG
jgi:HSP20 family protein